ncbi:vitamin B12 dependent-methionine synthase activation domain-containing protein [Treponema sp. R6D11]
MDTKEVLRYLGYRGAEADEQIISQIELVSKEAASAVNAKNVFGIWDCLSANGNVAFGEMSVNSRDLAYHLCGCEKAVLMAATLGTGADNLLRRYNEQDMEKALIAQAVCVTMIEEYCDSVVNEASQNSRLEGLYPTLRFSPGYGDFDIIWQKEILKLLNCEKQIALTLTEGYMLIPSKSVTAVVGFGKEKNEDGENKCGRCANTKCEYRRVD